MSALARTTDPHTSHIAAAELKLTATQQAALLAAAQLVSATANEIGQLAASVNGGVSESYRKRCKELVRMERLAIAGERRCSITGKLCTTYRVIPTDRSGDDKVVTRRTPNENE